MVARTWGDQHRQAARAWGIWRAPNAVPVVAWPDIEQAAAIGWPIIPAPIGAAGAAHPVPAAITINPS